MKCGADRIYELITNYEGTAAQLKVKMRWEVGKEFDWELNHGKWRGTPTKVRVAQKLYLATVKLTGRESYSLAWFTECLKFYERLSVHDLALLLRKKVPHGYVRWLVVQCGQRARQGTIKAIKEGKNTAPWRVPASAAKMEMTAGTSEEEAPKRIHHRAEDKDYLLKVEIRGNESRDELQTIVEAVLSVARRLGMDYENVVMAALDRIQKMVA